MGGIGGGIIGQMLPVKPEKRVLYQYHEHTSTLENLFWTANAYDTPSFLTRCEDFKIRMCQNELQRMWKNYRMIQNEI